MSESFDVVIIGAGPGGYVCAIRAAQLGLRVALVEKQRSLGGTCLNIGCIPSKALLESSEHYAMVRGQLAEHGIGVTGVELDLGQMMARKERIVRELTDGIAELMRKNRITTFTGRGKLSASDRVAVANRVTVHGDDGTHELMARSIVLATGSQAVELPFLRFDGRAIVSSTEALSFTEVPEHLLVVGAGAVGLELGSVWHRLGAEVTVVELLPTITPFADRQMANNLQRALKEQGLQIQLSSKVTGAEVGDNGVLVTLEDNKGQTEQLSCDKVLVSVGRRPYTEGLGLEQVGIERDTQGRVAVDEQLRTNIPNIYAIGDIVRGPMLAHKAEDEGLAAAEIIAGNDVHLRYDIIPNVVYTDPELAAVGRTEAELKEAKVPYRTGRFLFTANGRAKSLGQEHGMVKMLAHAETDQLLGVHIVGPRASELIAEAAVVMQLSATATDIAATVHAHPTLSEVVREAALAVDKRAIHG